MTSLAIVQKWWLTHVQRFHGEKLASIGRVCRSISVRGGQLGPRGGGVIGTVRWWGGVVGTQGQWGGKANKLKLFSYSLNTFTEDIFKWNSNYFDVKKSKTSTVGEVNKKNFDIIRFWLYEVNFDFTWKGHQAYFIDILRCCDDHQMWPQNWPIISDFFFFKNFLQSPGVWLFDIWQIIGNSHNVFSEYIQWITTHLPTSHLVKFLLNNNSFGGLFFTNALVSNKRNISAFMNYVHSPMTVSVLLSVTYNFNNSQVT